MRNMFAALLIFTMLSAMVFALDPGCKATLATANTLYTMTADCNAAGAAAYTITGENITLDFSGHAAVGNGIGIGISSTAKNTTIKNGRLSNFNRGLDFTKSYANVSNMTVNITVISFAIGIYVHLGHTGANTSITNSIINANGQGIILESANDSYIFNNSINSMSRQAMYTDGIINANITRNTFNATNTSSGTGVGIRILTLTKGLTFFNNTVLNTTMWGIWVDPTAGNDTDIFYANNISTLYWVNDTNGQPFYNTSLIGNIYYFPNGTLADFPIFNISSSTTSNWADGGNSTPYNATTVGGNWSGSGQDWHPFTLNTANPILCINSINMTNNTIYSPNGTAILLNDTSCNSTIYYNNMTALIWVNNSGVNNTFNISDAGNIYYFANDTGVWAALNGSNLQTANPPNWSSTGYGVNNTHFGAWWIGSGTDYWAWTENSIASTCITPSTINTDWNLDLAENCQIYNWTFNMGTGKINYINTGYVKFYNSTFNTSNIVRNDLISGQTEFWCFANGGNCQIMIKG